jgi:hypothetical protein
MDAMPSVWEVAGDLIGGPIVAPVVIGGAVVSVIASPEVRERLRRWSIRGVAAALAAGDVARRELRAGTNGTSGLAAQIGHRLKEAVAEVREDWDDFVAEARAERERRQPANTSGSDGAIKGMDEGSSGSAAMHGSGTTTNRRSRSSRVRRSRR